MSIGVMVDFIVYVLLQYYKYNHKNTLEVYVIETFETRGVPILRILSTLLGLLPLVGIESFIIHTMLKSFLH